MVNRGRHDLTGPAQRAAGEPHVRGGQPRLQELYRPTGPMIADVAPGWQMTDAIVGRVSGTSAVLASSVDDGRMTGNLAPGVPDIAMVGRVGHVRGPGAHAWRAR